MNTQTRNRADNDDRGTPGMLAEEQARRANIYALLAALLRRAPDQDVLVYLGGLDGNDGQRGNELLLSLSMLALSARTCESGALRSEFHDLFVGLGRGELVPFGSWYQTGFLNERPLGELRRDLAALGFERAEDVREPEDHIAALLEVMSLLIQEQQPTDVQQRFFETHLAPWAEGFFNDLSKAEAAVFYRAVARFARAFWQVESRYFTLLD